MTVFFRLGVDRDDHDRIRIALVDAPVRPGIDPEQQDAEGLCRIDFGITITRVDSRLVAGLRLANNNAQRNGDDDNDNADRDEHRP